MWRAHLLCLGRLEQLQHPVCRGHQSGIARPATAAVLLPPLQAGFGAGGDRDRQPAGQQYRAVVGVHCAVERQPRWGQRRESFATATVD